MQTRLQIPTTTRKMRRRALRTRSEIYFRVLGPKSAIEEKLSFVTRIYEAQNPEHWRGCTIVGFPRCMARDAMRDLRAARAVVLPIGHRSRYIAPREHRPLEIIEINHGSWSTEITGNIVTLAATCSKRVP